MPIFGYCWRGARHLAVTIYGFLTSGFRKVITRAIRRRLFGRGQDDANDRLRRSQRRPPLNVLQKGVLKRCIYKVQANDVSITSIKKLLERLERDISYKGNPATLRRLLKELGLRPIVSTNYREYFMENKKTISSRSKFLKNVEKYRREGRPIIYTAVSSVKLPRIRNLLDHRAVMAYAASDQGVIEGAITTFRYNMPIEQWYYLIRYERYEDWIRTELMPQLPPRSVIVMRTTPWNKISVRKTAMEGWLRERSIPFDSNMPKTELRKLINLNKGKDEHKTIDEILRANKHTVLRIPPFHGDLNPLEVVWMDIEEQVAEEKTRNNLDHVVRLTLNKLSAVDGYQMSEYYHKTTLIESGYRISGLHVDTMNTRLLINESIATLNTANLGLDNINTNRYNRYNRYVEQEEEEEEYTDAVIEQNDAE